MAKIIHPEIGETSITEVPEDAMPHYYRSGWRLLTDEETEAQVKPPLVPQPVTKAQAAKSAKAASESKEK